MRKPTEGFLLEQVAYQIREPSKITNLEGEVISVRDTFAYNPNSDTASETAKRWASGYYGKKCKSEFIIQANSPFSVTITDLDVRGEGGRAYKVVDKEGRQFDLREDQILEVMKRVGINPGGQIPGLFVWGVAGSQIRLVLVGGDLHDAMDKETDKREAFGRMKKHGLLPTAKTLVPGHVYSKNKSVMLYLGRVTRPHQEKSDFAFVELPSKPTDIVAPIDEEKANKTWLAENKRNLEVVSRWDLLTWRERCQFAWRDRYRPLSLENKYLFSPSIELYASMPRLTEDLGEVEKDLFAELKDNKVGQYHYSSAGNKYHWLAEEWKLAGKRRDYGYSVDYETRQKLESRDIKAALLEYRDLLKWQ